MIDLDKEKYFVIDELIDKKTADLFANYFIVKKCSQKFFENNIFTQKNKYMVLTIHKCPSIFVIW